MTLTRTSGCWIFCELGDGGLDGADDVALEDEVQVLDGARLHLREEVLERDARLGRAARAARCAGAGRAAARGARLRARSRRRGRARRRAADGRSRGSRPGRRGRRSLHLLAAVVVERAHLAPGVAGDDRVADVERAAVDEHRRDRAAADVEARLDDRARTPRRSGSPSARARRRRRAAPSRAGRRGWSPACAETSANCVVAAPLLGLEPLGGELGPHAVGVRRRAGRSC